MYSQANKLYIANQPDLRKDDPIVKINLNDTIVEINRNGNNYPLKILVFYNKNRTVLIIYFWYNGYCSIVRYREDKGWKIKEKSLKIVDDSQNQYDST